MIKNYKQFNEELSPELLKRASKSAYDRKQIVRGDNLYKAANDAEMEESNSKKRENYNEFMSLTGGILFGYECNVSELRVNPAGDTWIDIKGDFITKKGPVTRIFITDNLIKEDKLLIVDDNGVEQNIDLTDLVLDRKSARGYANFLNWWKGEQKPFSVDDYCIKGIHV
jgi:hypothetical protein